LTLGRRNTHQPEKEKSERRSGKNIEDHQPEEIGRPAYETRQLYKKRK
jgi:hypothetical protein